ncbi:UBX domain-containing protein 4 [Merluccius polli]|uniref:UBX domain-containing protein 4 n=1 Tax=Merluccius polli TaxID=89951 RepID=A0AA47MPC6_MERPO|nr:UBX domain-containing protein 4 [Merluccius polli]
MRWFEGSIPAAIASAKQQSLVFVVVITVELVRGDDDDKIASGNFSHLPTGEDELSAQLQSSWEEDTVSEAAQNCCVAIKVDAKSVGQTLLMVSYDRGLCLNIIEDPVVCIPSSFFIGENGIPLEVVAGSVSAEELLKRIAKVQQSQRDCGTEKELSETRLCTLSRLAVAERQCQVFPWRPQCPPVLCQNRSWQQQQKQQQKALLPLLQGLLVAHHCYLVLQSQAHQKVSDEEEHKAPESLSRQAEEDGSHSEAATPGEEKSSSDEASHSSQPQENLDEKVERLTKKLEERREQKKKGEEEGEIRKEVERRKQGKEMLDLKKKQEDDKTRRILEERNREKAEEKAARERVKQQIALDRADRAARYAKNQQEVQAAQQAALQARQAEQEARNEARKEAAARERSAVVRIQFRLPDGSFFTNQFPSESRLLEARQFAVQEVGNRYGNFSLATMFPRREFTDEDLNRTLLELELAPSASVVLLPSSRAGNSAVQASGGGVWAMLGTILYPLLAVWRFLSGLLFSSPPPAGAVTGGGTLQPAASGGQPNRETLRKRTLEKRPEDFKKDGKIYRLRTQDDSEDDTNTWNGNSTQQM